MSKPVTVSDLSSKGAKAANLTSTISSVGEIGSLAISVIGNIQDKKLRARFQNNLAFLNADQQKSLERSLIAANSESERLKILVDRLTELNVKRIGNVAMVFAEQERKKRNKQLFVAGGIVLFLVAAVYIIVKKA